METASLESIPAFAQLAPEHRAQLASVSCELDADSGSILVQEGDFGFVMFAILEGTADVTRAGETVARLGPGDVFGERAILLGGRRAATVTATSPMKLITVMNRDVWRLEREAPALGEALRLTIDTLLPA
jgi:CRP-like cAMP-binding protein